MVRYSLRGGSREFFGSLSPYIFAQTRATSLTAEGAASGRLRDANKCDEADGPRASRNLCTRLHAVSLSNRNAGGFGSPRMEGDGVESELLR